MIPDETRDRTEVTVLFKIISRYSWDRMHAFMAAHPGSRLEHVAAGTGIYVVHVPAGGAVPEAS